MGQITVFSGPERRRRWSDEERLQILTRGVLAWRVRRRGCAAARCLDGADLHLAAQAARGCTPSRQPDELPSRWVSPRP